MLEKIIAKLENKNIAILGFGREGKSTYTFIRKHMGNIPLTIVDKKDYSDDELVKDDANLTFVSGDNYLDDLNKYDLIMKTPGISLKDIHNEQVLNKITSQIELVLEVNRQNIIGITGTKGKSTTSSLTYEVIKAQNPNVYLMGNIGVPVLSEIDNIQKDSLLVIEMSSHQLEFLKYSPHIGCILNLYQDHLDHAGNVDHYYNIKMNMFRNQTNKDYAFYSSDNEELNKRVKELKPHSLLTDIRFDDKDIHPNCIRLKNHKYVFINQRLVYEDGKRNIIGDHNLKNIMFVLGIAHILGLDLNKAQETISNFKGLKYRMEYIGTNNDVKYYNDTIATIPEATMNAINAIGDVDTLIFGGLDRHIDYTKFTEFLSTCNVSNLVCMPTTGTNIGNILKENTNKNILFANTLDEAYALSQKYTKKGHSCLLSPAAASYEFFKNFEEKGAAFESIVKQNKN